MTLSKTLKRTLVLGTLAAGAAQAQEEQWQIVINTDTFNNYNTFENEWNYLYPWGSDHNGTARMYGSSSDHNHIYLDNGALTLRAARINWDEGESSADPHLPIRYHSGAIHAKHKVLINDQYPNYEVEARIRAPSSTGTWPAFWLTGANGWPPESDIMEYKGDNNNWQNTYTGEWQSKQTWVSNPGDWHTYRVWMTKVNDTEIDIHYYIDGEWTTQHRADFVGEPMWIILNLQMEGSSGEPGPTSDTYMNVDWVEVGRTVVGASSSSSSSSRSSSSSSSSSGSSTTGGSISCTPGNVDSWGNGFVLNNYTVTNNSDTTVNGWSVELGFNQSVQITNAWGVDAGTSGSTLNGANVGYNGTLAPGQSASFGMQGTSGSDVGIPSCSAE